MTESLVLVFLPCLRRFELGNCWSSSAHLEDIWLLQAQSGGCCSPIIGDQRPGFLHQVSPPRRSSPRYNRCRAYVHLEAAPIRVYYSGVPFGYETAMGLDGLTGFVPDYSF
ncbi:hypothetical protein BDV23DRAFT_184302 [Aspergillus alliaceus]|uniref:Uncharacterized protein n=1 Tax=Petromyces alliaceus TaxID=209559 RepID=A0A5N7C605_PETAA|nr:hypothetical protein BDV23DRAFT_184302 [Aspergillus alliaceus]